MVSWSGPGHFFLAIASMSMVVVVYVEGNAMGLFLVKAALLWVLVVIVILRWFSVVSSGPDEEASERVLPLTGQLPGSSGHSFQH